MLQIGENYEALYVNTYEDVCHRTEFFMELETFQMKVVEKVKICISYRKPPPLPHKSCQRDNYEKYVRARQVLDGVTT